TRWPRDWSSDVCSSDLERPHRRLLRRRRPPRKHAGERFLAPQQLSRPGRLPRGPQLFERAERELEARLCVIGPTREDQRLGQERSEERRVGKEVRWGGA